LAPFLAATFINSTDQVPLRQITREFDLQPARGEMRKEPAGVDDLLGHPGASVSNFTLDQRSRHAGGACGCGVRLGLAEKSAISRILAAPDVHTKRKPCALARGPILATSRDGVTESLDRQQM
jgi:hypothetical protein